MKVAVLTNSYPTKVNPHDQIFVKKLVDEIGLDPEFQIEVHYNYIFKLIKNVGKKKSLVWTLLKYLSSLLSFLYFIAFKAKRYDVLFTQAVIYNSFYGFICKKIFNKKYVIYVHGGDINLFNQLSKVNRYIIITSLKNADSVIVNSKDSHEKVYNICKRKDISIIPPGVDTNVFRSIPKNENPYIKKFKLEPNQMLVSFVGNAIERKGIRSYLKALDISRNYIQDHNVRLLFVTEGPLLVEIKRSIESAGLTERTLFLKKIKHEELNYIYNLTNILVFPSLNEPLGLVGLEAMAVNTTVIGSKVGGIKEYIEDRKNGFLFEAGNARHLSEVLNDVIKNNNRLKLHMKDTVEKYSLKKNAKLITKKFKEL